MTNKNFIVIVLVVATVSFVLGFQVSSQLNKTQGKLGQAVRGKNTFQAGWEAAKQRLAETNFTPIAVNMEIKTIYGEIKETKENKIGLKIRPLEPLADPELDNRIIIVDNDTKIFQFEPKDQKVYQKELEDFNKKMQERNIQAGTLSQPATPPEYFSKKQIKLADLKVGQQVIVTADKDIKNSKEFKAVEISLQSMPAASVIPPVMTPTAESGAPAVPAVPPVK